MPWAHKKSPRQYTGIPGLARDMVCAWAPGALHHQLGVAGRPAERTVVQGALERCARLAESCQWQAVKALHVVVAATAAH